MTQKVINGNVFLFVGTAMAELFLTEKELAQRWKLNVKTLRSWRLKPDDPTYPIWVKLGHSVRYPLADIEAYEKNATSHTNG